MGCSPSKGKLFLKPEARGLEKALLAEKPQDVIDSRPVEEENCLTTDAKENEPTEEHLIEETAGSQLALNTTDPQNAEEIKETGVAGEVADEVVQLVKIKRIEKRKKNKGQRRSLGKQKSSIVQAKMDFPPNMVRAHQAAYAFLNPNISKYETLLNLLDQAAQTQLSLQPLMSALVLRFEEINQGLEEMAEEGELMLKEHGDYMALPSGMLGPVVMQAKPSTATVGFPNPPPDLLQQLLQHSTEKMRLVGGSVQALGDTTLEEAAEYFSSLSNLLVEKLQAKQSAEQRLAQVLAWVEGAAIRKSHPEDSALHSEDSGIGGENESLTGSERHRHHRGSAGSGSCGSGINIRGAFETLPNPSHPHLCTHANYMQDLQPTVKRPLTAVTVRKPEHSSSTKCVNIIMELQNSQRELDKRIKKMAETRGYKELAGPHYDLYRAGLRRHSLSGSAGAQKGPIKANQSPCSLPPLTPQPPKRQSVRRLINTFSQGVDGRPGQSLANIPPHIRRPRKSEILLLSDTVNGNERGLVINGNNNNNSWPDSKYDLDVDNLPPPPPEVLMDNSFQSTDSNERNEEMIIKNTRVSQRLKASMQNVEVLPSRVSVTSRLTGISSARPVRQDADMAMQVADQKPDTDLHPEMDKANCLYQQARKSIHLRNAAEGCDKRNIAELSSRGPSPFQARLGQRCESNEFYEGEMTSCSLPVTAPPVSRVRLPPSCPSVCHRFPSPSVVRPQTPSRPSSRPGSPRMVTRATDNNTEEIIPSVSFSDARSVFSLNESQNSQPSTTSGRSVLPRPWGETSRGRLSMRRIDNSTRRTQSESPSLISHSEFTKNDSSVSSQAKGNESVTTKFSLYPIKLCHYSRPVKPELQAWRHSNISPTLQESLRTHIIEAQKRLLHLTV
ncbi:hypothetical protein D9C73_010163 [Collichthys lucidus]|uniref:Photoreceptor cilium actin regulator n=1 Tax=Collichthys lucidus TaxID=240159 RepID=A0A4U5ULC4_COLLU|nr:hypothetical protein D9C73_010163 [Collichthys lucidus]